MLVIRRRAGEALLIADNVEIDILELTASHVKIGIRAPREVAVVRKEIFVAARQNQDAAQLAPDAARDLIRRLRAHGRQKHPD